MDIESFMPHGMCFLWRPDLLGMHVISDFVIAVAYFSIPITIVYLLRKRQQLIPYKWVLGMFATFILLCGTTHVIAIVVIWYPIYYIEGAVKVLTAAASLATALMIIPLIPALMEEFGHSTARRPGQPSEGF